jgi:hypothetical protein
MLRPLFHGIYSVVAFALFLKNKFSIKLITLYLALLTLNHPRFATGVLIPPFGKGRRRRPEPQYSGKRSSGTLAPDGEEGFYKIWSSPIFI